jgi:hypothetical protein
MSKLPSSTAGGARSVTTSEQLLRVRVKALEIPPIKDGLVIGKDAPIGGEAMVRTLRLMTNEKFERIVMKDDVIEDVIVRAAVLKKLGRDRLVTFITNRLKPLMTENELLMLEMNIELVIEDNV